MMPTFSEIISYVVSFLADYVVFFAAGAVVTLMIGGGIALARYGQYAGDGDYFVGEYEDFREAYGRDMTDDEYDDFSSSGRVKVD